MIFPEEHIFPTRKDENWKYTSLKPWLEKAYVLSNSKGENPEVVSAFAYKAVFVNGCFKDELSILPSTIKVDTRASDVAGAKDSLVLLNSRYTQSTTVLRFADNAGIESAIQILFITTENKAPSMNYPQVHLEIGSHSKLSILIQHENQDTESETFVSSWLTAHVGIGAEVECVILQNQNFKSFHYEKSHFKIETEAKVKVLEMALGSLLSRSEVEMDILGPDIQAHLLGIYALNQNQQSDHYTSVKHLEGGSESVQVYKGLLDGKSKGVFNGHVLIAPNAQKANSDQLNKNLLLSQDAEINSKPELQIYADDVKATHGSTIGQIQKEEVFYLQTRGIKKEKAIQLVSEAFVMDVVHQLNNNQLRKASRLALQKKGAVK